jgi:hypothetical protein
MSKCCHSPMASSSFATIWPNNILTSERSPSLPVAISLTNVLFQIVSPTHLGSTRGSRTLAHHPRRLTRPSRPRRGAVRSSLQRRFHSHPRHQAPRSRVRFHRRRTECFRVAAMFSILGEGARLVLHTRLSSLRGLSILGLGILHQIAICCLPVE